MTIAEKAAYLREFEEARGMMSVELIEAVAYQSLMSHSAISDHMAKIAAAEIGRRVFHAIRAIKAEAGK